MVTNSPPAWRWLLWVGFACVALAVRLPQAGVRPMHTDEAVNACLTGRLLTGAPYHYDPQDRHGPALYAVALPIARLAGAKNLAALSESTLRLGPILIGTLTVLLFALLVPDIGLPVALLAALLWTLAPLTVYYSRYFIHETLFLAATLGLLATGGRWLVTGSVRTGLLTGFWAALLLATKETAVLSLVAACLAGGGWLLRHRTHATDLLPRMFALSGGFIDKNVTWQRPEKPSGSVFGRWLGLTLGLLLALGLLVLFYSWGGKNWTGPADLFRALPHVLARAAGEGHEKPWWYYLRLLAGGWTGWALLTLAAAGTINIKLGRTTGLQSCWLIYALALTFIYSAIPYKTPWLALNLFLPLTVLAALGVVALWDLAKVSGLTRSYAIGAVVVLILVAHDTRQWVFRLPADEKNPYAYAHTSDDLLRLTPRLAQLAGPQTPIAVVMTDPWPLPWYLRKYPQVGYWQPGQDPGRMNYYLTSTAIAEPLKTRLTGWRPEYFGLRPGVLLILWTHPGH